MKDQKTKKKSGKIDFGTLKITKEQFNKIKFEGVKTERLSCT